MGARASLRFAGVHRFLKEGALVKKLLPGVVALAIALLALIPGLGMARIAANHNQTLLG